MFDITCSIVIYNNPIQEIQNAIDSVLLSTQKVKVILVDNSEEDKLRYEFISPDVDYIYTGKNIGYGKAHNIAIDKVKGHTKYHLILNPDVEFNPSVLSRLFSFLEKRQDVGLIMPKVLYRNGELQYLCKMLPSPIDLIMRRFIPGPIKTFFKKTLEKYELKHKDYNSIMDIPNLSGCFMLVREEVFHYIGKFDERYFMYLEDTDFCRRINEYYRTIYYPKVSIIHGYSKASYTSIKLMKHHLQSSIKYFNKWGWLFDKERNRINHVVLNNELLPAMEKARAEKRTKKFNRPAKNKPLVTPAKILQPFSILTKSEIDYPIQMGEQTIVA